MVDCLVGVGDVGEVGFEFLVRVFLVGVECVVGEGWCVGLVDWVGLFGGCFWCGSECIVFLWFWEVRDDCVYWGLGLWVVGVSFV